MSANQIDALGPVLENASPVERLFFSELRHTRVEMEKLFIEVKNHCAAQKDTCSEMLSNCSNRISELEVQHRVGEAVDKAVGAATKEQLETIAKKAVEKSLEQYSLKKIAVGSAAGGGTIAALVQWMVDILAK